MVATPLVECIPNFSEARRPEVIEKIIQAIHSVPNAVILDRHSDMDHNRTVITMVGHPSTMEEAAFRAIQIAAENIDLNNHIGEHPRIGATDVVPFVPIHDVSMADCIEIARRLARRVGEELAIPVYLYEEAATRSDRQNLENIRRGEYELLKEEIAVNPDRFPDFGPPRLSSAGATVIGARQPLIAFNVYLTTDDVAVAQKIARVIRNSSGGLRFVKAMGVLVEGKAQVSMNLTNYRQTAIPHVVEMIRREAARYGVAIHHSELVGLIPQAALVDTAIWYTQLDTFDPEQILESRLTRAEALQIPPAPQTKYAFIEELAAGTPTPGGGSAAAFTAAMAAGLVSMVCRLTVGKKKYASIEASIWEILEQSEVLRSDFIKAVDEDSAAFQTVLNAMRLPKDTPDQQAERNSKIQAATLQAARLPFTVAEKCLKILELASQVASMGNINAISDAGAAGALAYAALQAASHNVKINTLQLTDSLEVQSMLSSLTEVHQKAKHCNDELQHVLTTRGGLPTE